MSDASGTQASGQDAGVAVAVPVERTADGQPRMHVRSAATTGLFLIAGLGVCYFARDMLVPIAAAVIVYLLLSPAVRTLARVGIPPAAGSALALLSFVLVVGFAIYMLASPAASWISRIPQITTELRDKLEAVRQPVEDVSRASAQVEEITNMAPGTTPQVVVRGPGLLEELVGQVGEIAVFLAVMLILAYFLLASGDLIRQKLVRISPRLQDKKRALQISAEIEHQVSRYLMVVTLVNLGVGACVGVGMLVLGMPNPLLWAAMAMFLSFIPFVGAWIGIGSLSIVAVLTFDNIGHAALAPAIYLVVHMIADNFVMPSILGRQLTLNPVAIVVSIILWGWLWGVPGALMAGPILITVKVLGDSIISMATIAELLGGNAPAPSLTRQRALSD